MSGHAAADQTTSANNQVNSDQQGINDQVTKPNVDVRTPSNGELQATAESQNESYNVVPSTDQPAQTQQTTEPNNYGYLDSVSVSNNELNVSGWQATNQAADKPYHFVIAYDNTAKAELGRQEVQNISRPDVAKAYPDATNAADSGFNANIKLNTQNDSDYLTHSISMVSRYSDATNGEGNNVDYWYPAFTFDQGNHANLDDMHTENNQLHVTGWNATNQAINKDYHYVILFDKTQNRELSRQLVNDENSQRPDVQKVYQQVNNAEKSGFNVAFDLSKLNFNANDQLQIISRYSDAANGEGNRVDYWFAPTSRENQGYLDSVNLSNGQMVVNGWHANDASSVAPYHFLILFDKTTNKQAGVIKASQVNRPDVAKAYAGIQSATKSGFTGAFTPNTLTPGHEYSLVSRYSTANTGNGDQGHYVDYWFNGINLNKSSYSIDSFTATDNGFHVMGWMASDSAINRPNAYVILLDNGKKVTRSKVSLTPRNDVAVVYPDVYNSKFSGFSTDLAVNPANLTGNLQMVLRFSGVADGNSDYSDQMTQQYTTNAGNFDNTIVNGNKIKVTGWHASTQTQGKDYQFIIALDQNGHELMRRSVSGNNVTRNDVAKVYPWLANSDKSGFDIDLAINNQINHKVVKLIHRYSNQANGEGSYVDFYSNPVSVNSEFQNENGTTVYYDPTTGVKKTGWVKVNNNNYYFDTNSGAMFTGKHTVDGKSYNFGNNGIAVQEDEWGWPFPNVGEGHFSGAQLFGVNAGGQFRKNGFHDGLDFGSYDHPGSEVHAIHSGKVTQIGYTAGLDWYVLVDTGEYLTVYQEAFANKNNIHVSVGQQINTGDIIGTRTTAHVHVGVTRQHNFNIALANSFNNNGTWLNPLTLIRNGAK